jgi:hypothetical protein
MVTYHDIDNPVCYDMEKGIRHGVAKVPSYVASVTHLPDKPEYYINQPPEDVLFSAPPYMTVSDRFKVAIEEIAPDHCEFCPVHIDWPELYPPMPRYWYTNWLKVIDCYDREKSDVDLDYYGPGAHSWNEYVIDPDMVSPDVLIFRLGERRISIVVRRSLKLLLDKHKFRYLSWDPMRTSLDL